MNIYLSVSPNNQRSLQQCPDR